MEVYDVLYNILLQSDDICTIKKLYNVNKSAKLILNNKIFWLEKFKNEQLPQWTMELINEFFIFKDWIEIYARLLQIKIKVINLLNHDYFIVECHDYSWLPQKILNNMIKYKNINELYVISFSMLDNNYKLIQNFLSDENDYRDNKSMTINLSLETYISYLMKAIYYNSDIIFTIIDYH